MCKVVPLPGFQSWFSVALHPNEWETIWNNNISRGEAITSFLKLFSIISLLVNILEEAVPILAWTISLTMEQWVGIRDNPPRVSNPNLNNNTNPYPNHNTKTNSNPDLNPPLVGESWPQSNFYLEGRLLGPPKQNKKRCLALPPCPSFCS